MPAIPRMAMVAILIGLVSGLILPAPAVGAPCALRCGFRVTRCVLDRGGVDGLEQGPCRRAAVRACQVKRAACPLPDHDQLAATLASVVAVETPAHHDDPLCAAALPAVPVNDITEAIAVGRDTAAALVGTTDAGFRALTVYAGRTFGKFFLQGTSGHGAAFVPLGSAVVALARPARAVVYANGTSRTAYGVVGVHDGEAVGIVLAYCPAP